MKELPVSRFLRTHARGIGEIFFLRDWKLGALLWCAFLVLHPLACGVATASLLSAAALNTVFRIGLSDDERQIASLNAFLTGIACGYYLGPHTGLAPLLWCAGAVVLHQVIFYVLLGSLLRERRLPILTLPFIVTTVAVVSAFGPAVPLPMPAAWTGPGTLLSTLLEPSLPAWLLLFFRSLGALLFVRDAAIGLVIACTVLAYSRILFSLGLTTFLLLLPLRPLLPAELPFELAAFNCMVTVMMIGAVLEVPSRWSYRNAFVFGAVALLVTITLARLVSPLLNLPFVVTILSYLATRQALKNEGALPFDFTAGTPEQNLYYARNRRDRYAGVALAPFGLPFNGEWLVTQGHNGPHTHREAWRHAWDFEIAPPDLSGPADRAPLLSDFPAHGRAVCAALDGEIVAVRTPCPRISPVNSTSVRTGAIPSS